MPRTVKFIFYRLRDLICGRFKGNIVLCFVPVDDCYLFVKVLLIAVDCLSGHVFRKWNMIPEVVFQGFGFFKYFVAFFSCLL